MKCLYFLDSLEVRNSGVEFYDSPKFLERQEFLDQLGVLTNRSV